MSFPDVLRPVARWVRGFVRAQPESGPRRTAPASAPSLDRFPTANHFVLERERQASLGAPPGAKKPSKVVLRELGFERLVPQFHDLSGRRECPGKDVAFVTVVNALYFRGLEGLLLSLLEVYPELESPFLVLHDGSISEFAKRRLQDIYPRCEFRIEAMEWFRYGSDQSHNHRRIGKLGFLNTCALELRGYQHVVLLDSDLLVLGDISELWQSHDHIAAGYCFGDREYVAVSKRTQRGVLNSGVIAIPAAFLTERAQAEMRGILDGIHEPACPLLDRFADQKAWNLFLADKPVRILPYNYNCNIKQVAKAHEGTLEGIRVLHYAGPKPWLTKDYATSEDAAAEQLSSLTYHTPWRSTYRALLYKKRLSAYRQELERTRRESVLGASSRSPDTCVILGNGPSIARTELLRLQGVEKICFNWFLHHPDYERIAPEHLVLASHLFFGGWNTLTPEFPRDFLALLRSKKHKPVLWAPFYFKPSFEQEGLTGELECNFVLFEKPFKKFVEKAGYGRTHLDGFLMDGRTAAISVAIPIACHLGFQRLVLVGCDSNYQQKDAPSEYFYARDAHTTKCNPTGVLADVWAPDGPGQFSYGLIAGQLRDEGKQLFDATIGGALTTVPKLPFEELVRELDGSGPV